MADRLLARLVRTAIKSPLSRPQPCLPSSSACTRSPTGRSSRFATADRYVVDPPQVSTPADMDGKLFGTKVEQDVPSFSIKAVYEAMSVMEDIIRSKKEREELQKKSEDAKVTREEELKVCLPQSPLEISRSFQQDRLEALDNFGAILVNGLEAQLGEKEARLTQVTQELNSIRADLVEEHSNVEELKSTCIHLEDKVQQLNSAKIAMDHEHIQLQVALQEAQLQVANAEGHRKIIANLNASLLSQSSVKRALVAKKLKAERAFKGAAERLQEMQGEKAASERIISRAFEELVEARNAFASDKYQLQTEVVGLRKEVTTLQDRLEASTQVQVDIAQQLTSTREQLASSNALYADLQTTFTTLQQNFTDLTASYCAVFAEKLGLQDALDSAQITIENEMSNAGEAIAHLLQERERTETLEARLAEADTLLAATKQRAADAECELNGLKFIKEHSAAFETEAALTLAALEMERDMYQGQEQEALAELEAERARRVAAEEERNHSSVKIEKLEQECLAVKQADQDARIAAQQDRDALNARLEDALARVDDLASQVRKEQDVNAAICAQLSTEGDAHANTRDALQTFQTRLAVTAKTLRALDTELQSSRETHHSLATTNKSLSRDLAEKNKVIEMLEMQTRFQSVSDEDAQTLMADLAKENIALKASKKSVEVALASKVDRCEVLEKEAHRLRAQTTPPTSPTIPAPPVPTSSRAALGDKENTAPPLQVRSVLRLISSMLTHFAGSSASSLRIRPLRCCFRLQRPNKPSPSPLFHDSWFTELLKLWFLTVLCEYWFPIALLARR